MARHGIVALLAATLLGVGVNAGPCKPYSSDALSSIVTLEPTTTRLSTITADITDTTDGLQTTVTEAATDVTDTTDVLETTVNESATETTGELETTATVVTTTAGTTDLVETTITETAAETPATLETTATETIASGTTEGIETSTTEIAIDTSTATLEPITTTTAELACVPTQILVNSGFDDNNDGSPWTLGSGISVSQLNPRTVPNSLYIVLDSGLTSTSISQELPALGPFMYKLKYYSAQETGTQGSGYTCTVTLKVNEQLLAPGRTISDGTPTGMRPSEQFFIADDQSSPVTLSLDIVCQGSFSVVNIGMDDFTVTRVCDTAP
ncbi:hypothetical protein NXS19_008353 [Fusarium pseudograminearum]|nr:hypothetical protein NXS19_008353 [Fusarium pseudograminearum]